MTSTGLPDYSGELNATLYQQFANGSIVQTPCYLDITKTPMQATSLTPVDDHLIAGAETDRWIQINTDTTNTKYRSYEIIGGEQEIQEG